MAERLTQRSFASGEIAPALAARADQAKYVTGLRRCRNFMVMRHGGATNRPGTAYVAAAVGAALYRFVYGSHAYVIEAGDQVFRFYKNGARVLVSGVTAWSALVNYAIGDLVLDGGVNYYAKAASGPATAAQDPPNATYWHPLTDDIYEIPTPYTAADLLLSYTNGRVLQASQSGAILTLVHPNYEPRELVWGATDTSWTLRLYNDDPTIGIPQNVTNEQLGGTEVWFWKVTAIDAMTGEESLASAASPGTASDPATVTNKVSWSAVSGARAYRVYRAFDGGTNFFYIGETATTEWTDDGVRHQDFQPPSVYSTTFPGAGYFPRAVTHHKQRVMFGGLDLDPERILGSRTGARSFTISSPLRDDDAVRFSLTGDELQEVLHLLSLRHLLAFTSGGVHAIRGDETGVITPTSINADHDSHIGVSFVPPVVVGRTAIWIQARGNRVLDLNYNWQSDGYNGKDLTVFASHFFEGHRIIAMDYAQTPHSIVWCVRSDGALLGLTYLPEQDIWAWHLHETGANSTGSVRDSIIDLCVVPEGEEDAVYLIVNRSSPTGLVIERMASRARQPVLPNHLNEERRQFNEDSRFLDCSVSRNSWEANEPVGTVTLALEAVAPGVWTGAGSVRVTATGGTPFAASNVGDAVDIDMRDTGLDGAVRIVITGFTSTAIVVGTPVAFNTFPHTATTVPAALRTSGLSIWSLATRTVSGLDHLQGKTVYALGDGEVYGPLIVGDGIAVGHVQFSTPVSVAHVGLLYTCDLETLDLDVHGTDIRDRQKHVKAVSLIVEETRGLKVGPSADKLLPVQVDTNESDVNDETDCVTGVQHIGITSTWRQRGRVLVRQALPLPATVLGIIPSTELGG